MKKNLSWAVLCVAGTIAVSSCGKDDDILAPDLRPVIDSVINGGGAKYPNKVFIDFSEGRQTSVLRSSYDLGFAAGAEFRVTLNSSLNMLAKATTKTDINAVTAADTAGLTNLMVVGNLATPAAVAFMDDTEGDLTKTAIAEVSATAADNKVYIVNRGADADGNVRKWQKIKVLRNGSGYTLQYADISATTFKELQITKDPVYNFNYVNLETGALTEVEPEKAKWDIAWTYFVNTTAISATEFIPYGFQDFVLQNRSGVQSTAVLNTGATAALTYDGIKLTDASALTFSSSVKAIGSGWRAGGGPTTAPSVKTDRFYVVKDAAGNYFKVQFVSLTKSGERGWPLIKFAQIK